MPHDDTRRTGRVLLQIRRFVSCGGRKAAGQRPEAPVAVTSPPCRSFLAIDRAMIVPLERATSHLHGPTYRGAPDRHGENPPASLRRSPSGCFRACRPASFVGPRRADSGGQPIRPALRAGRAYVRHQRRPTCGYAALTASTRLAATADHVDALHYGHSSDRQARSRCLIGAVYSPQSAPAARKVMVALGVSPLREPDSSPAAPKSIRNWYAIAGSPKLTCRRRP